MSMLVWLTRCNTVPCWLNGTPCCMPDDTHAIATNVHHRVRIIAIGCVTGNQIRPAAARMSFHPQHELYIRRVTRRHADDERTVPRCALGRDLERHHANRTRCLLLELGPAELDEQVAV